MEQDLSSLILSSLHPQSGANQMLPCLAGEHETAEREATYLHHVSSLLKNALSLGVHGDLSVSVTGSRKTIRVHKAVLSASSPLLRNLLLDSPDDVDSLHLCDVTFDEAMALLNLVYAGSVLVEKEGVGQMAHLAVNVFGLEGSFYCRPVKRRNEYGSEQIKRKKDLKGKPAKRLCRPILMKADPSLHQLPVLYVLPEHHLPAPAPLPPQPLQVSQYKKAKISNPVKYKCDKCDSGFPVLNLLKRHIKTHDKGSGITCQQCNKMFANPSNLKYHIFSKHSGGKHGRKVGGGILNVCPPAEGGAMDVCPPAEDGAMNFCPTSSTSHLVICSSVNESRPTTEFQSLNLSFSSLTDSGGGLDLASAAQFFNLKTEDGSAQQLGLQDEIWMYPEP